MRLALRQRAREADTYCVCATLDDEHTRALEEQWIEGDLTHETAQSESRLDLYRVPLC